MAEKRAPLLIRLPPAVMKELREAAELDGRSLNGFIERAIRAQIRKVKRELGEGEWVPNEKK